MSQSTITEKRTVISSSSTGGYESLEDIPYKANLGSRSSNILSRSSLPLRSSTGGGTSIVRTVEYGYGSQMGGGIGPGGFSNVSSTGVNSVKTNREREKRDLQDLNERFANYIEKVRFLEAQNRKLGSELDELRSKWGKETSHIKQMYEAELTEARRLIDDLSKDKAALEIKLGSVQEQNADINRQLDEAKKYRQLDRDTINKLNQQLADLESEINMLRRSMDSIETERQRDKTTINRLQQDLDKLRIDLNNETLAHLDAENRRQTLEEEMEFMKKVHEQELKELAALAYRDTTAENREFWKSELAQAIRDIQQEYDSKVDQLRGDMEGFYNLKIQEFRTGATKQNMEVTHVREENKKLTKQMSDLRGKLADLEARNAQLEKQYNDVLRELETKDTDHMMECTQLREEISKLRTEMEGILTELQTLMDAKLSLELEICAYRKLLEGEENRVDWRSRASLIMYRDAFRPSSTYERSETQKKPAEKAEVVKEEPVVKKEEITTSHEPIKSEPLKFEPHDASPDTDAASSITMSDHDSPKSEVPQDDIMESGIVEESIEKDVKSENEMHQSIKVDEIETQSGTAETKIDTNANISKAEDEHVVAVKEEVKKIESRKNDDVDSSTSPVDAMKSVSPESAKSTEISPIKEQKSGLTAEPETNVSVKTPSPIEEQIIPSQSSIIESAPEPDDVKTSPAVEEQSSSLVSPNKSEPANVNEIIVESKDTVCEGTDKSDDNKDSSPVKTEAISVVEEENAEIVENKSTPIEESTPITTENEKQQSSDIKIESTDDKSPSIDGDKNVEETKAHEIEQTDKTITKDTSVQEKETSATKTEIVTEQLASPPAAEDKQDEKVSVEVKSLSPSKTTDDVASLATDTIDKEVVSPKSAEKEPLEDEQSQENEKIVSPIVSETEKGETDKNEETTHEEIDKKEVTEVVEKTEDKLLETVVTSKSIVQESKVSPAMVESSPTKELPDKPLTETSSKDQTSESSTKSPVESDKAIANIDESKSPDDTDGPTHVDQIEVSASKSLSPAVSPGDVSIEKSISNDSLNEDKSAKDEKKGSPQTSPLGHPPEDPALIEEKVMTAPTQSDTKDVQPVAEALSEERSQDIAVEIKKDEIEPENVSGTNAEPASKSVVVEESVSADSPADTNQEATKISNVQSETETDNKSLEEKSKVEKSQVTDSKTETEQSEQNMSESSHTFESDNTQTNIIAEPETLSKESVETQLEESAKTVDVIQIDNMEKKSVDSITETVKAEDSSKDTIDFTKDSATSKSETVETQSKDADTLESIDKVNETKATVAEPTDSSLVSKESPSNPDSVELQATESQEPVVEDVSTTESKVSEVTVKQSESSSILAETVSVKEEVTVKLESDEGAVKGSTETSESRSIIESSAAKDEISFQIESKKDEVNISVGTSDSCSPAKEEDRLSEKSIKGDNVNIVQEITEPSSAAVESSTEVSEKVDATISEIKLPEGTSESISGKIELSPSKDEVNVDVDSVKHETKVSPDTHESSSVMVVESSIATEEVSVKSESNKTEITISPEKSDSKLDVDKSLIAKTNETEISESKSESKVSETKIEASLESSKTSTESSVVESVVHSKVEDIKTEITDTKSESKIEDKSETKTENASSTLLNGEHDIVQKSSTTITTVNTDASQSVESNVQETESIDKTTTENEHHTEDTKINGVEEDPKATTDVETKRIEQTLLNGDVETEEESKPDSQISMKMMRGEVSAKTTYQRTSTGPIAISEVNPEGKFIMLENTSSGPNRRDNKGRKLGPVDVNLDCWKLKRCVDGKRDYTYNFRNFTLKAGKTVKILARGSASEAGLNDLVFRDEDNWGVGSQVTTSLINDKEEDKASHIQKTLYN